MPELSARIVPNVGLLLAVTTVAPGVGDAATVTTCNVPPKATMPSPLASVGEWSLANL